MITKRRRYATILIDPGTRERIDVLPDPGADTLEAWLREHPGVQIVRRDGSGAYAEARSQPRGGTRDRLGARPRRLE
nr:hypothetical protein [Actinospica robiniae]